MGTPVEEISSLERLRDEGLISEKTFEMQRAALQKRIDDLNEYGEVKKPRMPLGFWACYMEGWRKTFVVNGRSSRAEFFSFTLINSYIATIISGFMEYLGEKSDFYIIPVVLGMIFSVLVFIPNLTIFFRRLHDRNQSAKIMLLIFVGMLLGLLFFVILPSISLLVLAILALLYIYLCISLFLRGTPAPNRYGPCPTRAKPYVSVILWIGYLVPIVLYLVLAVALVTLAVNNPALLEKLLAIIQAH